MVKFKKRKEMAVGRKDEEIQKIQLRRVRKKSVLQSRSKRFIANSHTKKKSAKIDTQYGLPDYIA